ncbi:unnamed protein product [Peronospora belbahrii]|uniref:Protein kinase domain-containing protein n=1 Tax=Peronospora belbahrii TaxID=622444 RepID=A0ABN8CKD3_9STRA|nr:unnamed protein product [Peronospora belbahrii]
MRRSRHCPRRLVVSVVLSAIFLVSLPTAAQVSQTNECEEPAPTLVTLRRSKNAVSDAEVVYHNCTVVKISATSSSGTTTIDASNLNIQAVSSFPHVTAVMLSGNQVTTIYEDPDATVKTLDLSSNGLSTLDALTIPNSVTRLVLDNNSIIGLDGGEIPDTVTTLSLKSNGIVMLNAFNFSETLEGLDTSENIIHDLSMWQMPSQLQTYSCKMCDVKKLSGMKLPPSSSLSSLDLEGSTIDSFEISKSMMPLVVGLSMFKVTVSDTRCSESIATKQEVQAVPICVLPDAVYDIKFATPAAASGSRGISRLPPNGDHPMSSSEANASSSWMLVAIISGSTLLLVLIGGLVVYLLFHYRHSGEKIWGYAADRSSSSWSDAETGTNPTHRTYFERTLTTGITKQDEHSNLDETTIGSKHRGMSNTMNSSIPSAASISARHFDNDIRTDQNMRHLRLMHEEVVRGGLIAKGGYGAVYKAKFRGKTVVLKQLLPERACDPQMLNDFMDEIRMCSSLDHPKIVTFIGFTFTSLMDLSAVFEHMPNGDLATHLQKQLKRETRDPTVRESYGWFYSPQSSREGRKCKSLVALDIAEALVYLHSFESPMIHRDLKPNNILLSETWEAKLTDFGVSRELREDQTMTAEIGTVSWIAPEVLRGERYSEKADVYSFGVIMTELDTCRRPYSEGVPNGDNRGTTTKHTNARIAVLVSAGSIRPSLSPECPNSVRKLVDKCLDGNPLNRPSALQLHFELRNLEVPQDDDMTTNTMPAPQNNSKSPCQMSCMQEHSSPSELKLVLIEDDDIALLSSERRDHV